jgi:CxxC-x17-CxxC domain-containing protein
LTTEGQKSISVKIEKPSVHQKKRAREKCCATCGKPFALEPDQKFFDCPACYQKKISSQKPRKRSETKVLTQIRCASCGVAEFVGFVPDDLTNVLCGACFKQAREQKKQKKHIQI